MRWVTGAARRSAWAETPGFDESAQVPAALDEVARAFVAVDDIADGGIDELSGGQGHGDVITFGVLRPGVCFFPWGHAENVRRGGGQLQECRHLALGASGQRLSFAIFWWDDYSCELPGVP